MSRILIVEDEESIAKLIAMNLRVSRYQTRIFNDGNEAVLSLPEDHQYDLAILDIMLPGKNGFEIMEELRPYDIPVIFLSARSDLDSKVTGLSGGAEDYIVKPFEILELLVRIEKVLSRTNKTEQIINIGDLEIRPDERVVKRDGIEIPLKPMEFDLLIVLARNRNHAISREQLLKLVWGTDFIGETRTVDVHIGQLRKKLGIADQLKTVSKLGYRLEG